jgi:hypothetical protein
MSQFGSAQLPGAAVLRGAAEILSRVFRAGMTPATRLPTATPPVGPTKAALDTGEIGSGDIVLAVGAEIAADPAATTEPAATDAAVAAATATPAVSNDRIFTAGLPGSHVPDRPAASPRRRLPHLPMIRQFVPYSFNPIV